MTDIRRCIEMQKPIKLKNILSTNEVYDRLASKASVDGACSDKLCNGPLMMPRRRSTDPRPKEEMVRLAKEFNDEYYASIKRTKSPQHQQRWEQITQSIDKTGTYDLTDSELVYGAKLAWRNAPRCIGRIQWSKLQVFDARYVTTASGMFEAICKHIKYGTNKGNIRSAITIFPHRTDGKHDFRIWNNQLIIYAGYRNDDDTITGDPINVEFTEVCQKLGWKGKGGRFDVLPIVVSAGGQDPEWFDLPKDLILEVHLQHPEYKWFSELGLKWFTFPAVSGMLFDCGGLEFPASPFNGWYMSTEIGTRNFCDPQRYNLLEPIGQRMGLDTTINTNLWKDKVILEVNLAVLYSFQKVNATIVDHHTASESFMKHFENEYRIRGGCPSDWIWIVPPISGSSTEVYHQEMSLYYLKPSYEYQEFAWKTHEWKKNKDGARGLVKKTNRKFRFKEIARAVKFTSKLFRKALSKRIKATILYATETGKSENYAKKLGEIFGHTFNAQVYCMADYDFINIEHEALVLIVTSTFGNGDPPENGETFAKHLFAMKTSGNATDPTATNTTSSSYWQYFKAEKSLQRSFSFMRMSSLQQITEASASTPQDRCSASMPSGSSNVAMSEEIIGPLSNVRFAVFGLGSSAYPNFCSYGKYVDNLLGELGGERLCALTCGDELAGQEQAFKLWAAEIFKIGCEAFCLEDDVVMQDATAALKTEAAVCAERVKLSKVQTARPLHAGLSRTLGKNVKSCKVKSTKNLHGEKASEIFSSSSRWTQQVVIDTSGQDGLHYEPGDHIAIAPANRPFIVNGILKKLTDIQDPDHPYQVMVLKEIHTPNGSVKTWEPHEKLPEASVRTLLTRYLDITTPPTSNFLHLLAEHTADTEHRARLEQLATDPVEYEEWKHTKYPHLLEVFEEFPSVQIASSLMLTQLPILQSRFYSISSSPKVHANEIHITVAVVVYNTMNGNGPTHYGVCSNYLRDIKSGEQVDCFVRNAASFHLPSDKSDPIILVGPGTGIAPFRSFWQEWNYLKKNQEKLGKMTLFFGCRTKALDLYKEEKQDMVKEGALSKVYLALSREPHIRKTYVQDMLYKASGDVFQQIVVEGGHLYVCGDCTMAECVYQRLRTIIQEQGKMTDQDVENFMLQMREENRYHEDIFGITLRTEEIHRQTRQSNKSRVNLLSQTSMSFSQEDSRLG